MYIQDLCFIALLLLICIIYPSMSLKDEGEKSKKLTQKVECFEKMVKNLYL